MLHALYYIKWTFAFGVQFIMLIAQIFSAICFMKLNIITFTFSEGSFSQTATLYKLILALSLLHLINFSKCNR